MDSDEEFFESTEGFEVMVRSSEDVRDGMGSLWRFRRSGMMWSRMDREF